MDPFSILGNSRNLLCSAACYERLVDLYGHQLTPRDVASIVMRVVRCKVYSKENLIHVRRCIEVTNVLPDVQYEVPHDAFHPDMHVVVTCEESHVNQSLGVDTFLRGAKVRGWRTGRCVVWW